MKRIDKILIVAILLVLGWWGVCWAADTELVNMTELDIGNADMLIYVVNDPNVTPVDRKIPLQEMLAYWTGSTAVTTLGTITTGTWNAAAVTSSGTITSSGTFDVTGANPMVLGSGDVTTFTVTTDGTGNAEFTLPNDVIGDADIDWGSGAGQVDLADIPGGTAGANAFDFGGATSVEIPNSADPDVDAAGEVSNDTDGANETGDVSLRGYDGSNQFLIAQKLKYINVTLISPDTIDAADLIPVWHNTSGMTFTILEWKAWSDDDDVSLELEELTDQTDYTARTQIDAVEIATNGTGVYYASDATITHAAIEHDHSIAIDFDTADTPDYVQICIVGWFNADVD